MCKPRPTVGDGPSSIEAFNSAGRWIPSQLVFNYGQPGALVAAPSNHDAGAQNWSVSPVSDAPTLATDPAPAPATATNQVGPFGETFGAPQPLLDTNRSNFPGFRCGPVGQTYHCDANVTTTPTATTGAGLTQTAFVDVFNELPWLSNQALGPRTVGDDAFRATLSLAGRFTQYGCMIVNRTQRIAQCGLLPDPRSIRPVTCRVTKHVASNDPSASAPMLSNASTASPTFAIQPVPPPANAATGVHAVPRFQVTYGHHTLPCFPIADLDGGPLAGFLCGGADDSYLRVDSGGEVNQTAGSGYSYGGSAMSYSTGGTSYGMSASSAAMSYSSYSAGMSYSSYASGTSYSSGMSYSSYSAGTSYSSGMSYSGMSYGTAATSYSSGMSYGSVAGIGTDSYYGSDTSGASSFNSYLASYGGTGMHVSIRVQDEPGVALGDCAPSQSYSSY